MSWILFVQVLLLVLAFLIAVVLVYFGHEATAERKLALSKLKPDSTYVDDQTLFKVASVLKEAGYTVDESALVISRLLNAGILFREKDTMAKAMARTLGL